MVFQALTDLTMRFFAAPSLVKTPGQCLWSQGADIGIAWSSAPAARVSRHLFNQKRAGEFAPCDQLVDLDTWQWNAAKDEHALWLDVVD